MKNTRWVSRAPETLTEAKALANKAAEDIARTVRENGYKTAAFDANYAGIRQR
jgi:hypothetical protein